MVVVESTSTELPVPDWDPKAMEHVFGYSAANPARGVAAFTQSNTATIALVAAVVSVVACVVAAILQPFAGFAPHVVAACIVVLCWAATHYAGSGKRVRQDPSHIVLLLAGAVQLPAVVGRGLLLLLAVDPANAGIGFAAGVLWVLAALFVQALWQRVADRAATPLDSAPLLLILLAPLELFGKALLLSVQPFGGSFWLLLICQIAYTLVRDTPMGSRLLSCRRAGSDGTAAGDAGHDSPMLDGARASWADRNEDMNSLKQRQQIGGFAATLAAAQFAVALVMEALYEGSGAGAGTLVNGLGEEPTPADQTVDSAKASAAAGRVVLVAAALLVVLLVHIAIHVLCTVLLRGEVRRFREHQKHVLAAAGLAASHENLSARHVGTSAEMSWRWDRYVGTAVMIVLYATAHVFLVVVETRHAHPLPQW